MAGWLVVRFGRLMVQQRREAANIRRMREVQRKRNRVAQKIERSERVRSIFIPAKMVTVQRRRWWRLCNTRLGLSPNSGRSIMRTSYIAGRITRHQLRAFEANNQAHIFMLVVGVVVVAVGNLYFLANCSALSHRFRLLLTKLNSHNFDLKFNFCFLFVLCGSAFTHELIHRSSAAFY